MDHFQQLTVKVRRTLQLTVILLASLTMASYVVLSHVTKLDPVVCFSVVSAGVILVALLITSKLTTYILSPFYVIWSAILHVSPDHNANTPMPDPDTLSFGRDLAKSSVLQIYQLASQEDTKTLAEHRTAIVQAASVLSHIPLPLFVLNKQQVVVNASDDGLAYCLLESAQVFGKPLYDIVNFEFSSDDTLDKWATECQNSKVTDTHFWQRVHVRQPNAELKQCDIAAYYNRDNPSGTEFIVVLMDRTVQYNEDDHDIDFVALAVHELRTPLTILRGYIEVFEEELEGKLDPELHTYLQKMIVSARQLGTFFNNILNVARIEQDQMELTLSEGNWNDVLKAAINDLQLKAKVHNRQLTVMVAQDLPTVAVDKVSIVEVINNLVDNAIKYSPEGDTIVVDAHLNPEGQVETTVQDHGIGVPSGVLPHLFDKFYRSHRTSKSIGGTGLGLYLCKSIVNAHGGQIWAKSKEGEGATFGFSLVPYSQLAAELKDGDNKDIVRSAHGWIKNHSLYRR